MQPDPILAHPYIYPQSKFKILVLVDLAHSSTVNLNAALEAQKAEIETSTGGVTTTSWEFRPYDLSACPWQLYGNYSFGQAYGPSFAWIEQELKKIQLSDGDKFDFIQLVFDESHWGTQSSTLSVFGYSLNQFIPNPLPNYSVQIIRSRQDLAVSILKKTFDMELAHSFDNFSQTIGLSLNTLFGVVDFDEDVIHGRDPRYPVFQYSQVYAKLKDILFNKLFPTEPNMLKLVIKDNEQYVRDINGLDWHIANVETLADFKRAGIISTLLPETVTSINPSGKDWLSFPRD